MSWSQVRYTRTAFALATLAWVTFAAAARAQQRPELPQNVKEWMQQDQIQRWSLMISTGDSLFNNGSCTRCHATGATGGPRAPDLTDTEWVQSDGSLEGIRRTIFWGVERDEFADPDRPFEMNPQGGMSVSWDEIRAVAAYVWSLSNGDFLPRRGGGQDAPGGQR